jgi:hypothetical protein
MAAALSNKVVSERVYGIIELMFAGGGHPSHWRQESYRQRLWRVFDSALEHDVCGDNIRIFVREHLLGHDDQRSEEKYEILRQVCDAWDEWAYARAKLAPNVYAST